MIKKILYSLVFAALVGGEIFRIQLPNSVAVSFLDCTVLLLVISLCIRLAVARKWLVPRSIFLPFFLFVFIALVSLVLEIGHFSLVQLEVASLYLIRLVCYTCLFFVAANETKTERKFLVRLFVLSGGLFVCIGYLQYIFYPALRNLYYLGWDEHLYRLFSTLLDPNFAGAFLVLFVSFLVFLAAEQKNHHKLRFILLLIGIVLTLGALVLTFSRSALIMFGVMAVIYLFIIGKKRYILALFFSALLLFLALLPFSHIENTNLLRIASSEARLDSAKIALIIFSKHPILGVGFNTYRYAQVQYGFRASQTQFPSHANSGTDNSFLFLLATTGSIGTLVFGFFIYRLCNLAWQTYRKKRAPYALLFLLSIIGILVDSLFINSLFYPPLMLWVFILGGFMIRDSL